MKGHVPTPDELAETMVRRVFRDNWPTSDDRILYPGCGDAPFAAAVERVCDAEGVEYPDGLAVETNPKYLKQAKDRGITHVEFQKQDFLSAEMLDAGESEYIIGNPPYVPIEGLSEEEKERYRTAFTTAVGRFDLYILFFERSLEMLAPGGVLSFVTPEKFEYVDTAAQLRKLLTRDEMHVEEIKHIAENSFTGLVTFPTITTIRRTEKESDTTRIILRDGTTHKTTLPANGTSWAPDVRNADIGDIETGVTLDDITVRVSCGIATGADSVFVFDKAAVPENIGTEWIRPTVSGRQLREFDGPYTDTVFLCPYRDDGSLPDEGDLGEFGTWAEQHRERLQERSCVQKQGTPWYGWHENPPLQDILQPKIVWKDIAQEPRFWPERVGDVVPKHSVYYAVPKDNVPIDDLVEYLNSPEARLWMEANCQRAANGFYRLQSRVLKQLPVPRRWAKTYQATL